MRETNVGESGKVVLLRLLSRGPRQEHDTDAVPAILLRFRRRYSAQGYKPDVAVIYLKAGMQVIAHENRSPPGQRKLITGSASVGITFYHDCSAHHTISKLGNCFIDPHFAGSRKHVASALF